MHKRRDAVAMAKQTRQANLETAAAAGGKTVREVELMEKVAKLQRTTREQKALYDKLLEAKGRMTFAQISAISKGLTEQFTNPDARDDGLKALNAWKSDSKKAK